MAIMYAASSTSQQLHNSKVIKLGRKSFKKEQHKQNCSKATANHGHS